MVYSTYWYDGRTTNYDGYGKSNVDSVSYTEGIWSDIMIENRVNKVLNEKEWSFADLQDMNGLVNDIATMLYDEMSAKDKLELIWEDIGFNQIKGTSSNNCEGRINECKCEF